ncbi:M48 family metallopeptidase [Deinococcus arenicola]|uniref:M48 family metallopeptidase n=1 Tax=Deinococcus arenicola TaxID=2994950 RepID=A0ABU4DQY7_9DEIO|nr:M48 family metallopeptidase [Deinococcus sp. ZS9-10]MDV6374843.1 M48 family metallopeptidase [Deinococcus sp. ZS9-10]
MTQQNRSITLQGVYFDGRSSRDQPATLTLDMQTATLQVEGFADQNWPMRTLGVEAPIPGVRRAVTLPGGGRFETRDDAGVSAWERATGRNRALSGVRALESRWWAALAALGVSLGALALFVAYGIPALAQQAAFATPRSVLATFDRETIDVLQGGEYFGPSKLSAARQATLKAEFREVAAWAGGGYPYRLLLRDGEAGGINGLGANAFALPGGTVVMTDQLVALAKSDRELMGVLAHETGHVTNQHGLAGVYQALGLALVTTVITGDIVSAGTFAAAVPAALLRGGYSRAAETQADEVSGKYMLKTYGTTKPLQTILARLEKEDSEESGTPSRQSGPSIFDLLRTHPGTPDRIQHLKQMEAAGKLAPTR